jgi:peptidylprolyl isomerase
VTERSGHRWHDGSGIRRVAVSASGLLMVLGVTACGTGTSASTTRHPARADLVTFVAPVTCTIDGKITFTPPLTTNGNSGSAAMVSATLTKCDHDRSGGTTLRSGRLSESLPHVNDCATLYSVPASSGGAIRWTPTSRVAASGGVSLVGFSGSLVSKHGRSYIYLSSSGGSVESGSFANAGGTSLTITSTQSVSTLLGKCARGLATAPFTGTVTMTPSVVPVSTPLSNAPAGAPAVLWSAMTNGLQLYPQTVACPSTTLCVFAGESTESQTVAVEASEGPFTPGTRVSGPIVDIPQPDDDGPGSYSDAHLSCPSVTLCLLVTPGALYASSSPLTGPWVSELTVSAPDYLRDISCPDVDFCAAVLSHDPDPTSADPGRTTSSVVISTQPLDGARTWSTTEVTPPDNDVSLSAIACPSPHLCVVGGGYGEVGSWIETSSDPTGGSSMWSGGALDQALGASGPSQYALIDLGCPTPGFCVGFLEDGQLKVSDDPAGGFQTWHTLPGGYEANGVAWCTAPRQCAVADAGTFSSVTAKSSPVVGDSPEVESCLSLAFCVSIDDSGPTITLEVGRVTTATVPWPPPIASIARPTAAGRSGTRPPRITVGPGYPPTVLEESDLIQGTGAAVKAGDTVTVQYVEVGYSTPGTVVQTTWTQAPQKFTVGRGEALNPGEDEGVVGMKVGGRRELIIPSELADPGRSDATIVLVVDLLRIS